MSDRRNRGVYRMHQAAGVNTAYMNLGLAVVESIVDDFKWLLHRGIKNPDEWVTRTYTGARICYKALVRDMDSEFVGTIIATIPGEIYQEDFVLKLYEMYEKKWG